MFECWMEISRQWPFTINSLKRSKTSPASPCPAEHVLAPVVEVLVVVLIGKPAFIAGAVAPVETAFEATALDPKIILLLAVDNDAMAAS